MKEEWYLDVVKSLYNIASVVLWFLIIVLIAQIPMDHLILFGVACIYSVTHIMLHFITFLGLEEFVKQNIEKIDLP